MVYIFIARIHVGPQSDAHVCMQICIHVFRTHACAIYYTVQVIYRHSCTCTHICIHTYIYIYSVTSICTITHAHTHTHNTHVHRDTHIHTYMYVYIHAYTYTDAYAVRDMNIGTDLHGRSYSHVCIFGICSHANIHSYMHVVYLHILVYTQYMPMYMYTHAHL